MIGPDLPGPREGGVAPLAVRFQMGHGEVCVAGDPATAYAVLGLTFELVDGTVWSCLVPVVNAPLLAAQVLAEGRRAAGDTPSRDDMAQLGLVLARYTLPELIRRLG